MARQRTGLGLLTLAIALGLGACGVPWWGQGNGREGGPMAMDGPHGMHGGDGIHGMDLGPADGNYDLRFIDAMVLHHQGAIAMAETALAQSQRSEIQQLAQAIIDAQEREILQMLTWRRAWYPDAPADPVMFHPEMNHEMPMTPEVAAMMRMDMDLGPGDGEFDLRFINAMVPHHQGALVMAQDLQGKSDRPEMQQLATDILASQQGEIAQMLAWRQVWYGQ